MSRRSSLGSEKSRSSSAVTTSSTAPKPRSASHASTSWTRISGTDAPDVTPDRRDAVEPCLVDLRRVVDAMSGRGAVLEGDLDQPDGVRGVRRPDDDHEVRLRRDLLDRDLAVLGRVADVVAGRVLQPREPLAQPAHRLHGLVDRERGLGQPDHVLRVADGDAVDAVRALDERDVGRRLAGRALDLLVPRVADQQDVVVVRREPDGLLVDLGDQRAGGVDGPQVAARRRPRARRARRRARRRSPPRPRAPRRSRRRRSLRAARACSRRACCGRSAYGRRPARRAVRGPSRRRRRPGPPRRSTRAAQPGARGRAGASTIGRAGCRGDTGSESHASHRKWRPPGRPGLCP